MHRVCSGSMGWKIPVAFFPGCCYNRLELNTQMVGAAVSLFCGAGGKRETGERPVRSRHCESESSAAKCHCESEKARRCDDPKVRKPASHWYRVENTRVTRNWPCRTPLLCAVSLDCFMGPSSGEGLFFRRPVGFSALNRVLFKEFLCERHKEEKL